MNLQTQEAKKIYFALLDYYIICADPLYGKLCNFARQIKGIKDANDRQQLTAHFEKETQQNINYFSNPNA